MQSKAYLVLAHPNLAQSRANAALLDAVSNLEAVKVRHLDVSYPDYNIDVQKEQAACATSNLGHCATSFLLVRATADT